MGKRQPSCQCAPHQELPELGDAGGSSLMAATVEDPAKPGVIFTPEKGKRLLAVEVVVGNVSGGEIVRP